MDQLVERVREALTAEYPGAPNARVRDVPDRRAIRWYTTIGLVDKPLGMRGRTALYGPQHLRQIVAIKRRQAEGQSLSQIQVEFSWVSPESLSEIARVPEHLLDDGDGPPPDETPGAPRTRFWAELPATPAQSVPAAQPAVPDDQATLGRPPRAGDPGWHSPPKRSAAPPTDNGHRRVTVHPGTGVTLGGGVLLFVPHTLTDRDRDDIAAAAAPLLDLLAARGLTDGSPS